MDWLAGGWQTEARDDNAEPPHGRRSWLAPDEYLARGFASALPGAMYHALAREGAPQEYLEALAVGKLASIVAGPLGWYLDDADRAIAAVDLGRAERGLPALSQLVLSNAHDIAVQALQFAADDPKRAARELERGKANSAAETEPKRAADYARNLAAGNPASE